MGGTFCPIDGSSTRAAWCLRSGRNAAGAGAAVVAAMLGVDIPVIPRRRNLACTEPAPGIPGPIPMCVDLDTGVLIRREEQGFLMAYSNPEDPSGTTVDELLFSPRDVGIGRRRGLVGNF